MSRKTRLNPDKTNESKSRQSNPLHRAASFVRGSHGGEDWAFLCIMTSEKELILPAFCSIRQLKPVIEFQKERMEDAFNELKENHPDIHLDSEDGLNLVFFYAFTAGLMTERNFPTP